MSITDITLGELVACHPLYVTAMRGLIQEGQSLKELRKTVCWSRLETLAARLPGQYDAPERIYRSLRRSQAEASVQPT